MERSRNIEAEIRHSDGSIEYLYSPFSVENRWPGITVNSSSFRDLPVPEKFYSQSIAFLQAAKVLCEMAGQMGKTLSWSHTSVCYYCLNIATELFLKACVLRVNGEKVKLGHDISKLLAMYREVLPSKEFEFVTLWAPSWKEIEENFGVSIVEEVDHHPDQLFRYGVDREGKGSAGTQWFTPDTFWGYVNYLGEIWEKAWSAVSKT